MRDGARWCGSVVPRSRSIWFSNPDSALGLPCHFRLAPPVLEGPPRPAAPPAPRDAGLDAPAALADGVLRTRWAQLGAGLDATTLDAGGVLGTCAAALGVWEARAGLGASDEDGVGKGGALLAAAWRAVRWGSGAEAEDDRGDDDVASSVRARCMRGEGGGVCGRISSGPAGRSSVAAKPIVWPVASKVAALVSRSIRRALPLTGYDRREFWLVAKSERERSVPPAPPASMSLCASNVVFRECEWLVTELPRM